MGCGRSAAPTQGVLFLCLLVTLAGALRVCKTAHSARSKEPPSWAYMCAHLCARVPRSCAYLCVSVRECTFSVHVLGMHGCLHRGPRVCTGCVLVPVTVPGPSSLPGQAQPGPFLFHRPLGALGSALRTTQRRLCWRLPDLGQVLGLPLLAAQGKHAGVLQKPRTQHKQGVSGRPRQAATEQCGSDAHLLEHSITPVAAFAGSGT